MVRRVILRLLVCAFVVFVNYQILHASIIDAMKVFDPKASIPLFDGNPKEQRYLPAEGNKDALMKQAHESLSQNAQASEIMQEAKTREHVPFDGNSDEIKLGDALLSKPIDDTKDEDGNFGQEESVDMGEGITRLGALAGGAEEVSAMQLEEGNFGLFRGQSMECKKYPLGIKDCCTGSGWGDWVVHCPKNLQALQEAKRDNRFVYLGSYKKHKTSIDRHHVYCVFPSKLSGIIQLQGRSQQLHIGFGWVKQPNCRGLTPVEFSTLNFDGLDFSPIEKEFKEKYQTPNAGQITQNQQSHINRMKDSGVPHD